MANLCSQLLAVVGARFLSRNFMATGVGAGAETNSSDSAALSEHCGQTPLRTVSVSSDILRQKNAVFLSKIS